MKNVKYILGVFFVITLNCSFVMHGDIKYLIETALTTQSSELLTRTVEDSIFYYDSEIDKKISTKEFKNKIDTFFILNPVSKLSLIINQSSAYDKREFLWHYFSKNKKSYKIYFIAKFSEKEGHYHLDKIMFEESVKN